MAHARLRPSVPELGRLAVVVALSVAVPAVVQSASFESLYARPFVLPPASAFPAPPLGPSAPVRPEGAAGILLAPGAGERIVGRVTGVMDGDTVEVRVAERTMRLRLSEVDAPERTQPFGPQARTRLESLVGGRDVEVQVKETDRYGRSVSWVFVDGQEVGRILVREGLAWWYRAYSQDAALGELEREAREARRGLWSQENPEAPWDYRRRQRASRPSDIEDPSETDPMEGHEDAGHAPFAVPAPRR